MLNSVTIMGRLAKDPELRKTTNGTSVSSFRLAVSRDYQKEETDWIDVIAWKQTAEFVSRYFSKGRMIAIEGSIQTRKYEDKNGNKRTAFEVVAERVSFCGDKPAKGTTGGSINESDFEEVPDDDLPF